MSLPDGPRTPATLQLIQWIASPLSFMRSCSDRYGDCFTVYASLKCLPSWSSPILKRCRPF
jgi:cytochrome P450 family 110